MTDARQIPPCPMCRRHSCPDPAVCRRHMLHRRCDDDRQVRGLDDDLSMFVLTPDQWDAKYGRSAA